MLKLKQWLVGLLGLQVVLMGGIYFASQQKADFDTTRTLINLADTSVDKIVIEGNKQTVTLIKQEGKWVMPDYFDLPAPMTKVDEFIEKVAKAKLGWPVATSSSSQERLQVGESNFDRHLQFYQGGKLLGDVYFGTSPNYRSVHARLSGDDNIYSVQFAKYDLFTDNKEWFDRGILRVDEISTISGKDFEISKAAETWQLVNANVHSIELDQDKAKKLPELFAEIWIQDIAESFAEGQAFPEDTVVTIDVKQKDNNWSYHFAKVENDYLAKRNDINIVFKIRKKDYDSVAEWTLGYLRVASESSEGVLPTVEE